MANPLMNFMAEAKRRRVFHTAGVYLVAVWGVSQGAAELGPLFGAPDWLVRNSVVGMVALFPLVVILAWMFDIRRGGIVRDPMDVVAQEQTEDALASMPTMLGGPDGVGSGVVIVRWRDARGENAVLYLDEFFIGRGVDCRVRFYDPLVSRRHARVFYEDGDWFVEDLGSRNGTLVGKDRVQRRHQAPPLETNRGVES